VSGSRSEGRSTERRILAPVPPPLSDELLPLRDLLAQEPDVRLAYVFGSVARGTAGPESDLDVAVEVGRALGVERKMALIRRLAEASGRPVDLVDLWDVGEPLRGEILQGKRLVGSVDAHAQQIFRHLCDKEDFLPLRNRILEERRKAWLGR
jgi:uncharacterized protein